MPDTPISLQSGPRPPQPPRLPPAPPQGRVLSEAGVALPGKPK